MEFIIIAVSMGCILGLVFTEVVDRIENKYVECYMNEVMKEYEEMQ